MTWVSAATAPDQLTAEMWRGLLENAGIPARVGPGDVASYLGVSSYPCRVMVEEEHLAEAVTALSEYLREDDSAPPDEGGPAPHDP